MLRYLIPPGLVVSLFFTSTDFANAQRYLNNPYQLQQPQRFLQPSQPHGYRDRLEGTYVNQGNGGSCSVYRDRGGAYTFINEHGTPAQFVFVAPGQLRMIAGGWDPNIVATVSADVSGRTVIRFDAPFTPTGYWVSLF